MIKKRLFALSLLLSILVMSASVVGCHSGTEDTSPPTAPQNIKYSCSPANDTMTFYWESSSDEGSGLAGYLTRTSWQGVFSETFVFTSDNRYEVPLPRYYGTQTFEVKAIDNRENESQVTVLKFNWKANGTGAAQ